MFLKGSQKEIETMKRYLTNYQITEQHVRIALTLGALVLFVLGAGAPLAGSGGG
jgi:hypothetical protein